MVDIKLDKNGDIDVSAVGDISLTASVRQAVLIRLRWIYGEWKLHPDYGFHWFEEVFVKNPNLVKIRSLIRDEILQVEGVKAAEVTVVKYDKERREASVAYTLTVDEGTFREEVTLYE